MSNETVVELFSSEDFQKICRICLNPEYMGPISNLVIEDIPAAELIDFSISLKVRNDDCLPQNVCESCLRELHHIYEFKRLCHNNQEILESVLEDFNKAEPENIVKEENDDCQWEELPAIPDEVPSFIETNNEKKSARFKCKKCKIYFLSKKQLIFHYKLSVQCRKGIECRFCGLRFSKFHLQNHMRSHTLEKPYLCELCPKKFSQSANLRRHKMIHTGERPHVCPICGKGFIQKPSLTVHMNIHKRDNDEGEGSRGENQTNTKTTCEYCGRTFQRLGVYERHLLKHTGKIIVNEKNSSLSTTNENKKFVCQICGLAYQTISALRQHMVRHKDRSETFLCNQCGKTYAFKSQLSNHLRSHSDVKPFKCKVCLKEFRQSGQYESHMLAHLGHKPYTCEYCEKSFTQLAHMKTHLRTHTGERPYSCHYCGKTFALNGNLTVHIRTHTGETPFVCPVCKKGFYDSSSMKKHRRTHHEEFVESGQKRIQKVSLEDVLLLNNSSTS